MKIERSISLHTHLRKYSQTESGTVVYSTEVLDQTFPYNVYHIDCVGNRMSNFLFTLFSLFSEPIVEIKARINISIASWFKGTPIPMVCIAEQSDFEKEQLHVS